MSLNFKGKIIRRNGKFIVTPHPDTPPDILEKYHKILIDDIAPLAEVRKQFDMQHRIKWSVEITVESRALLEAFAQVWGWDTDLECKDKIKSQPVERKNE